MRGQAAELLRRGLEALDEALEEVGDGSEGGKKYGCSWWWLRNQGRLKDKGNDPSRAVFIGQRASIRHYAHVDQARDGVRPAVKLDLLKK